MKKTSKQKCKEKRRARRSFLSNRAKELRLNTPRSELWFYKQFQAFQIETDERNIPFAGYIPDIINKVYKYIIEVDGSIHLTPEQKLRDKLKDIKFSRHGYTVIRVIAYNKTSLEQCMQSVLRLRGPHYKPARIYTKEELKRYNSK